MASHGGAAAATGRQIYYCHQCNHTVALTPSPSPSDELACTLCGGDFLEEVEDPTPAPFFTSAGSDSGLPLVFSSGGLELQPHPSAPLDSDAFNPLAFLENHIQSLIAGGANIQFVVDDGSTGGLGGLGGFGGFGGPGFGIPANFGDFFVGGGLEQLIQQLAENDPNRYGTPPAAKSAVESLPGIAISEELLASDAAQCAVCMETFEFGSEAKQMPCKHIYHPDCILPWLELHNSCPVCRFELPTDDPDYEQRMRGGTAVEQNSQPWNGAAAGGSAGSAGAVAERNSPAGRTVERRFRIQVPWPGLFRAFGSNAETSNSGSRGNDDGGQGNSGNQQNQHPGNESRQEDLD